MFYMKHLCFELTMPNCGSWDGKWTGSKDYHFKLLSMSEHAYKEAYKKYKHLYNGNSWHYSWNDGWGAEVRVTLIEAKDKKRFKKMSVGFCGYDWMIDSIIEVNEIMISSTLKEWRMKND